MKRAQMLLAGTVALVSISGAQAVEFVLTDTIDLPPWTVSGRRVILETETAEQSYAAGYYDRVLGSAFNPVPATTTFGNFTFDPSVDGEYSFRGAGIQRSLGAQAQPYEGSYAYFNNVTQTQIASVDGSGGFQSGYPYNIEVMFLPSPGENPNSPVFVELSTDIAGLITRQIPDDIFSNSGLSVGWQVSFNGATLAGGAAATGEFSDQRSLVVEAAFGQSYEFKFRFSSGINVGIGPDPILTDSIHPDVIASYAFDAFDLKIAASVPSPPTAVFGVFAAASIVRRRRR